MFFQETETLTGKTIRDTLKDEHGRVLVVLNIAYPACAEKKTLHGRLLPGINKNKKKTPLQQHLGPFYERAAENFAAFARGELLDKAKANPAGTPPCGAVLRWTITEESEEALTIRVEGKVFDGRESYAIPPDVRRWNKRTGLLSEEPAKEAGNPARASS